MAVWVYAYGRNGLGSFDVSKEDDYYKTLKHIRPEGSLFAKSIDQTLHLGETQNYYRQNRKSLEESFRKQGEKAYKQYLISINKPYTEINDIIDVFIEDQNKRDTEKLSRLNRIKELIRSGNFHPQWEKIGSDHAQITFGNKMLFFEDWEGYGFRFKLVNDLIWITGPFSIFSVYTTFQEGIDKEIRDYYHLTFKEIFRAFNSDFILYTTEWSGIEDEDEPDFNFRKLQKQIDPDQYGSFSIHNFDTCYYEKL